ncbi:MAG: molybdenum cofactor guanylyltransferase [Proteobacteria bacterium]|nr:molybdenum cofactor guanylyltransferase [Pseudomonadota bacterium]
MRVAGVILAGGEARRMGGGDKPLLDLGGRPMLARILDTLEADLPDIAISANGDPARFAPFGHPVLNDGEFAGEGPLAGVLAGMDWAAALGCAAVLTVPGDAPFVPRGLPALLAPPPACILHGGQVQHLVALWPVLERGSLRALLSTTSERRVAAFATRIGMRHVASGGGGADPFVNVNTPHDLALARQRAEEGDDADRGDRRAGGDRPAAGPRAG